MKLVISVEWLYILILILFNIRQQLEDAKIDISLLRENLQKAGKAIRRKSSENDVDGIKNSSKRETREKMILKMEELQLKHNTLKHDLQRLLDEKEDIIREKQDMSLKVIQKLHLKYLKTLT